MTVSAKGTISGKIDVGHYILPFDPLGSGHFAGSREIFASVLLVLTVHGRTPVQKRAWFGIAMPGFVFVLK